MTKRSKEPAGNNPHVANSLPASVAAHPPAKQPTLLAVSLVLFALWFVFLLVTALFG